MYDSRPAMIIVSVVLAVIVWFVISIVIYPTTPRTIYDIPLTVSVTDTTAEENGLSVISYDVEEVTVQIEGSRSQVGNLDSDNMTASVDMSEVTTAGTKTLSITVTSDDGITFDVKSVSPSTVDVVFDYIVTETFDVTPSAPQITYTDGCVLDEENFVCSPSTIDVTGPQQELDQVSYCVAETQQSEQLAASKILTTDTLLFYNENGTEVDSSNFSYDVASFSIEIPVLYQTTLDITYQITNAPSDFDLDSLDLELSETEIILAAPSSTITEMTEFNIGSISLYDISLDYSQDFTVTIPDEYTNESGISTVTLTLDDTGLVQKDFVITDIGVINAPASYDFEVLTSQLTVSIIGPEEDMEDLDASDITVNVDLLSYSVQADAEEGNDVTFTYTPTISCSKFNTVWATGDYRVAVRGTSTTDDEDDTSEESTEDSE